MYTPFLKFRSFEFRAHTSSGVPKFRSSELTMLPRQSQGYLWGHMGACRGRSGHCWGFAGVALGVAEVSGRRLGLVGVAFGVAGASLGSPRARSGQLGPRWGIATVSLCIAGTWQGSLRASLDPSLSWFLGCAILTDGSSK